MKFLKPILRILAFFLGALCIFGVIANINNYLGGEGPLPPGREGSLLAAMALAYFAYIDLRFSLKGKFSWAIKIGKEAALTMVLVLSFFSMKAQDLEGVTASGIPVYNVTAKYTTIQIFQKGINGKDRFFALLDFGLPVKQLSQENYIKGSDGKSYTFSGVTSLFLFMDSLGYEFYTEFHKQVGSLTTNVQTFYVFRKIQQKP